MLRLSRIDARIGHRAYGETIEAISTSRPASCAWVRPSKTSTYPTDMAFADTEPLSQLSVTILGFPYDLDITLGNFVIRMILAVENVIATLLLHIPIVVGLSTEEKMIGVYTRPNIAFVADTHTIRNRTMQSFPYCAMRPDRYLFSIHGFLDSSITVPTLTSRPENTFTHLSSPRRGRIENHPESATTSRR